jgi:TM2 domain-containing membrane protein YozV
MYCKSCGISMGENVSYCPSCGEPTGIASHTHSYNPDAKSRMVAGVLALFLGYLGVHNFYLGHTGKGIAQLLLTTVGWILLFTGPMIAGLWSFIEALQLFLGSKNVDAKGIRLKD